MGVVLPVKDIAAMECNEAKITAAFERTEYVIGAVASLPV
jgi:hypothetical protein